MNIDDDDDDDEFVPEIPSSSIPEAPISRVPQVPRSSIPEASISNATEASVSSKRSKKKIDELEKELSEANSKIAELLHQNEVLNQVKDNLQNENERMFEAKCLQDQGIRNIPPRRIFICL